MESLSPLLSQNQNFQNINVGGDYRYWGGVSGLVITLVLGYPFPAYCNVSVQNGGREHALM